MKTSCHKWTKSLLNELSGYTSVFCIACTSRLIICGVLKKSSRTLKEKFSFPLFRHGSPCLYFSLSLECPKRLAVKLSEKLGNPRLSKRPGNPICDLGSWPYLIWFGGENMKKARKTYILRAFITLLLIISGDWGIRTLDTLSSIHTFQACSFNHSDKSPFIRAAKIRFEN